MKLKVLGASLLSVGVLTFVGGNIYADQQLKKYYQQDQDQQKNAYAKIQLEQLDLGTFSGTADYRVALKLDPCQANDTLSFQVQDKIQRTLTGYQISSKIIFSDQAQKHIKEIFKDKQPLDITTDLSWFGKITTNVTSPAIDHQKDQRYFYSKGLSLTFSTDRNDLNHFKDFDFEIPSIIARDHEDYLAINQLNVKTDELHLTEILDHSVAKVSLGQFKLLKYGHRPIEINIHDVNLQTQTLLKNQKFDILTNFKIGKFELPKTQDSAMLDLNFDFKGIDAATFKAFAKQINDTSSACETANEREQINQALLRVIEKGFNFESNNNVVKIGTSQFLANFVAKIPTGKYSNEQDMLRTMPLALTFEGNAESSRDFFRDLVRLNPLNSKQSNPEEMADQMVAQMLAQGALREEGGKLLSKFEYKLGKSNFINN